MNYEKVIEEDFESLLSDIKQIVSINSVQSNPLPGMPFGQGTAEALSTVLKMGSDMGFETTNYDNYAGQIDFGVGDEMVGILCHVDVVPAGKGWICDPYQPEIIDGKLYGRGVLDDKGPLMVCLHAMKILKEQGLLLKKRVRMIIGANEETDWAGVDYYFNQKKIEPPQIAFTPDAEFPLKFAEKGVLQYQLITDLKEEIKCSGGNAVNAVAEEAEVILPVKLYSEVSKNLEQWQQLTGCKFVVEETDEGLRLVAQGRATHAMHPEQGINAITGLMSVLAKLPLEGELARIAAFYQDKIGSDLQGRKIGAFCQDELSGDLSFNVGKMEVKNKQFILSIDNRVPVTYPCQKVVDAVEKNLDKSGFSIQNPAITEAIHIDKNSFLVKSLMDVYKEVTGDQEAQPQIDGGCTYARTMKNCVAFGALLPDQPDLMHQKNEYVEVEKLKTWMRIYLEAIIRLAN